MNTPETPAIPQRVAEQVMHHVARRGMMGDPFIVRLLLAWDYANPERRAALAGAFPDYGAAMALLHRPGGLDLLRQIAGV